MPTQRPFFANFFSAFRARSSPTFQAKSSTTTGAISPSILSASAHVSTTIATATSASAPRNITTKTVSDTTSQGNHTATINQPIKTASTSPFGATTLTSGSPGTTFYRRPPSPSPHGHNLALSPPGHANPIARGRQRRDSGSSNSSGGFMEAMGTEKWYVGGRTATGEERFYQLSLVSGSDGRRLQRLSCTASTKCLHSVAYPRLSHSAILDSTRTRCFSHGDATHPRLPTATCFESRPQLVVSRRWRIKDTLAGRNYSSAQVARDQSLEDQPSAAGDEKESYTGDSTESLHPKYGRETLEGALPIHRSALWNVGGLIKQIRARLQKDPGVVCFDSFKLWDDVVPIIATNLGLRHTILKESSPYYYRSLQTQRCSGIWIYDPHRPNLHVLTRTSEDLQSAEETDGSLTKLLRDHIFNGNVDLWLQEFRQNVNESSFPIGKVFMLVCKNSPAAMPRLQVVPATTESWKTKSGKETYEVKLINEQYNISIVQRLPKGQKLSVKVLNAGLLSYLEAIHRAFPTEADFSFRFDAGTWDPGQFLGKALSALDWGDVNFDEVFSSELFQPTVRAMGLWKIKLSTPKHYLLGATAVWHDRKLTRLLAILHACNVLKGHLQAAYESGRLIPEQYQIFAQYWNRNTPDFHQKMVLAPDTSSPAIYKVAINETIVSDMLETLRALVQAGFRPAYQWISSRSAGLDLRHSTPKAVLKNSTVDQLHYRAYQRRRRQPPGNALDLPVRNEKICTSIKKAIESSDVTIITAATGSGKTTQVPQILLDEYIAAQNGSMCTIVCTQPRRVSTISVANRVASERNQPLGREVGYKVRFDSRPTQSVCGITYMTSGYLLRLLEVEPLESLSRYSHIILDEVHARDVDTDLILANLKNYLGRRTVQTAARMPKIILMSASIKAEFFQSYFEELGPDVEVTTIDVPGKMYDVAQKNLDHLLTELQEAHPDQLAHLLKTPDLAQYIEGQINFQPKDEETTDDENQVGGTEIAQFRSKNQDLFVPISLIHLMIVQLLSTTSSGDILVFLPGLAEIDELETLLQNDRVSQSEVSNSERCRIFKLHSALYQTNYDVFKEIPARCRRIVLATNIAETSITLPSVEYVIDTGLSRQTTFDQVTQSGTFGLQWISKAEVLQRRGRAGRTQAGVYYGLYSQARYDAMSDAPIPEMLRMSLDQLVLRCSSSQSSCLQPQCWPHVPGIENVRAGHVLLTTPSPPEASFVAAAALQLQYIHALDAEGRPTPMGHVLSHLPISPTAAKTVLLGMIFRCLDAALITGALREDSPLMYDPAGIGGTAERRRKLAKGNDDDKLADAQAFFLYDRARKQNDNATAEKLREELFIRHDAYCEYAQIAEQTFETIRPMMGLSDYDDESYEDNDTAWPLFPTTPSALSTNSTNADLVKALAFSTAGIRFACWNHKNWRAQLHPRVLPHPKSVNHNGSKRTILAQRLRREDGDLLSYTTMRTSPKDKYPWLHDTSAITPLMAILFAESVSFADGESRFVINDWVEYELSPVSTNQDVHFAAKVIWEYRKALDRFVAQTMQKISLEPRKIALVETGELKIDDFNVFFRQKNNPVRKLVVDSVIKVLGVDAKDRKTRAVMRALEYGNIEPAVADDIQKRGDLEGLIELILERGRGVPAGGASNSNGVKKFKRPPIREWQNEDESRATETKVRGDDA